MGKFFKQTKLTSFRRQLNLYDFQRITHGRDAGSYYHELFLRGRPLLAKRMVRRKVKGTKIRASSSPDDEPNFYKMIPMEPLTDIPSGPVVNAFGQYPTATDPSLMSGNHHGMNGFGSFGNGATHGSSGANLSSFTGAMPGSNHPMMNHGQGDHHGANGHFNNSLLQQQQQQAAMASLHSSPNSFGQQFGQQFQNNIYSDLMNMNRMQHLAPHLYGGGMNNLDYITSLQQRNALASSALGFNNGYNPYLQGDPSLLGLQGGADPRLSPNGKSPAGAMNYMMNQGTNDTTAPAPVQTNDPPPSTTATTNPRVLTEQMNQGNQLQTNPQSNPSVPSNSKTNDAQPNEENKQDAVEQLLRLQKDQSSSTPTVDSKPDGEKTEIVTPDRAEMKDEKPSKKEEASKTNVLEI